MDRIEWDKYWSASEIPSNLRGLLLIAIIAMEDLICQVFIYTDSRGLWLRNALTQHRIENVAFHVNARKGAGLHLAWTLAEYDLMTRKVDMVIIATGICDLTERSYNQYGVREYWPPYDSDLRFRWVENTMKDVRNNFLLLDKKASLVFMPEPGADLLIYNRHFHPAQYLKLIAQESFMNNIEKLQKVTRSINDSLGSPTPRWLEATHDRRGHQWVPVYSRLYDGLHPTAAVVDKHAQIISEYVNWRVNVRGS